MERGLNEATSENITPEIQANLFSVANEIWFTLYLRNLDFNGDKYTHLTDDDVIFQAEAWEKKAKEMLEKAKDDWTRQILQETIELVPKVFTGMYGYVAEEEWEDFCCSSREMAKKIRSLFKRYGLEKLLSNL